jgi:mono/diheme cytochrome c family protein
LVGDGQGVIAYRGPMTVPTLHQDRLRTVPIGYFFDVITNGIGRMYSYASRIPPEDRWAIAAYVRALQLSQNTDVALLSEAELEQVKASR